MSTVTRLLAVAFAAFVAAGAASGCANIIGLEKAEHDPSLDPGGAADSGTQPGSLCDRYCTTVMKNCTGDVAVYASREACLGVCERLPRGTEGEVRGNSVACRLHFAESALSTGEPASACPSAGPGGNGVCGDNCSGFCAVAVQACKDEDISIIKSLAGCQTACAKLPDPGGYTAKIVSGFTVQCRLYHVSAATIDPAQHCPHVEGIGPCSPGSAAP